VQAAVLRTLYRQPPGQPSLTRVFPLRNPSLVALVTGLMAMQAQAAERLSIENIRRGTVMMLELVERLVYAPE